MVQSAWNQEPDEPRLGRNTSVHFTVSLPGSENSSRAPSPAPSLLGNRNSQPPYLPRSEDDIHIDVKGMQEEKTHLDVTPGRRPMDVYDVTLSWWRAAIRRKLVKTVQVESKVIARMQDIIRTPWLDAYFVYTSSLGTHTFFMTVLPAFFFFGYSEMGRGLLIVLALGVYCSSFVKDLICSPRPFAPPVTRLTIGSHHLEYGFPSTHTTNCVSIALFVFGHIHRLASTPIIPSSSPWLTTNSILNSTISTDHTTAATLDPIISSRAYTTITIILLIYTFSIVFGRIYTAMHSFTDCAVGLLMGAGIWWGHSSWSGIPVILSSSNPLYWVYSVLWPSSVTETGTRMLHIGKGLGSGEWVEGWVIRGGWEVPLILIPFCLLAVNQHPQPVDDCPCFEDAIAFISVVLGSLVGKWAMEYSGAGAGVGRAVVMPGSGWVYDLGQWVQIERTTRDVFIWWTFAVLKMVAGIFVIFVWRLLAKSALHLILPPTYRGLARIFRLPNRRFYTPATDYKSVPSEFSGNGLHPIPSVIDLPSSGGVGIEVGGIGSGVGGVYAFGTNEIKLRGGSNSDASEKGRSGVNGHNSATGNAQELGGKDSKDGQPVKHYDADVLTKVVVYAGIAVLACELLPAMFEVLGWGVRSWV